VSELPIILVPPAIARIQSELPPIPEPSRPQPPPEPQRVEWKKVALITLAVALGFLVCGGVSVMVAPGLTIGISLLAGLAVSGAFAGGAVSQLLSFPERCQKHSQDKQRFILKQQEYSKAKTALLERKRQYQNALDAYRQKREQLKAKCHAPEKIAEFRQEKYVQALRLTGSHDGTDSTSKVGSSEALLGKALNLYFPNRIQTGLTLTIPGRSGWSYDPDFAYLDKTTGLRIDIEVDEPYTHQTGEPIHYRGKDERRNSFFLGRGWLVIRFSEKQVVLSPNRCCKTIAQVIAELTGDSSVLNPFTTISDLEPMPQWTYEEALDMAQCRHRDQYQPVKKNRVKPRSPSPNLRK